MENAANWRTESRTVYSSDFKLRMVELHDQMPTSHNWRGNMALIIISFLSGYASGREGRISRRMPATIGAGGTSISSGFSDSVVRRRYQRPVARRRE
jgi:hypothetical protein